MDLGKHGKLYGILLVAMAIWAALTVYAKETPAGRLPSGQIVLLNNVWERYDLEEGIREYRYSIARDAAEPLMLVIKGYLPDFSLLVGDEEVYSYVVGADGYGHGYHCAALPREAQGKTLTLRLMGDAVDDGRGERIGKAYLGGLDEVYIILFQNNLYALIFLIFSVLVAVALFLIIFRWRTELSDRIRGGLISMGGFSMVAGIWVLTDSDLLLLVTGHAQAILQVSFTAFMMMPLLLVRFIQSVLNAGQILDWLCRGFYCITAAYLLGSLFSLPLGSILLPLTHLLCMGTIAVIIAIGVKRLRQSRDKMIEQIVIGLGLLSVFIVAALVLFYRNPLTNYASIYCIGIALFMINLMQAAYISLYSRVRESAGMVVYKRLAYLDAMTGMGNRAAYIEAQQQAENETDFACIVFDINNLKRINDERGHQEGDRAIVTAAKCIQEVFGEQGMCFRIGGDEFVVLLKGGTMAQITDGVAEMRRRIYLRSEAGAFPVEVAAGGAVRQVGETMAQMVRRADVNMYEKKQQMKERGDELQEFQISSGSAKEAQVE